MTELGNRLKEERLAKGLSLDDLQAATKIQKRYLSGIEEGNYSTMPGDFYVRAFIKQYCEAIGLNADEIFEEYKGDIPSPYQQDLPEQLSRVKSRKGLGEGGSRVIEILPKILVWVVVLGVAALIYYVVQQNAAGDSSSGDGGSKAPASIVKPPDKKDTEKQEDKPEAGEDAGDDEKQKEEEPAEPETPAQELEMVQSAGTTSTYELKNAEKFELKVVSKGETWVSIKNGKGNSFFQGLLAVGKPESEKTVDFSNESEAVLRVGNSVDTDIFVNGEKLEFAIPPTKAVSQNIKIRYIKGNE
ncbi:helix-turn-helix domain-containing protein [Neobacillus piezotolerans]|uniref:Helix-turn-helix domain-containing protein n=1 Tax=Neobacillus piezotolerans TaxID=2259171 RepID=A0A3D8GVX4_9BACI|nr:RodZ domain-containing protein [Neobacillus piezotolerans]RDU38613.1 helix-turn-helix domain-containing protein [Neobacillus piezotolerans]